LRRRIKAAADLGYPKTVSPELAGVRRLADAVKTVWG
jgi:hypothetical protein